MSIQVGEKAPDFDLPATGDKERLKLSDFHGKPVVLLFYPFAWSGGCTTELCGVRDHFSEYEALNAQILAVSVDPIFTLRAWTEAQGFQFPLVSDFLKKVAQSYGVLWEEPKGFSKRSAFVIDKEGIVRYEEVHDDGKLPDMEAIKTVLASLQ